MTPDELKPLIGTAALARKLDPALVTAQIWQESGNSQFAYNPEPRYRWFWDVRRRTPFRSVSDMELASKFPPKDFPSLAKTDPDQEWWAQQSSFGLMQVMGAVAREQGFGGVYLLELVVPEVNLRWGCAHLADLLSWADGDVRQALAAYNGGKGGWKAMAPQLYAAAIIARMRNGETNA